MDEQRALFLVPEATATLVIDDGVYAGAEIEARLTLSPTVYFGTKQWLEAFGDGDDGDVSMAAARELSHLFLEHGFVAWNLGYAHGPKKGEPRPATVEGMLELGIDVVAKIVGVWIGHIGEVPLPLPEARPTGRADRAKRPTQRPSSSAGGRTGGSRRPRSTAKT